MTIFMDVTNNSISNSIVGDYLNTITTEEIIVGGQVKIHISVPIIVTCNIFPNYFTKYPSKIKFFLISVLVFNHI